jgi:hypothetical protein
MNADAARLSPEEAESVAQQAEAALESATLEAGSKKSGKKLSDLARAACTARLHASQSALAAADDAAASNVAAMLEAAEQKVDAASARYCQAVELSGSGSTEAQAAEEQLAACQQHAGEACRAFAAHSSQLQSVGNGGVYSHGLKVAPCSVSIEAQPLLNDTTFSDTAATPSHTSHPSERNVSGERQDRRSLSCLDASCIV